MNANNPASKLGAVIREVRSCEREGRPAHAVVATRVYDTTAEDLWDALTNAERIPRWFLPVSGDLRLGGRYSLEGNASGEIRVCEPPSRLEVTWEFAEQLSWVEVRLVAEGPERTRLELEHTVPVDDHWKKFGPGAVGVGWDLALDVGLARHLSTKATVDPDAAMAWSMSPEGKSFVRAASEDWGRAAIAGGQDAAEAIAVAARTAAFYTGEAAPEPQPKT